MKKTYYSIHSNKTKRKKVTRKLSWKVRKTISTSQLVISAMKRFQELIVASQPIPKYSKGAIIGTNNNHEIVVDKLGNTSSPIQTSFRGITAEELTTNAVNFAKQMKGNTNSFSEYLKQTKPTD